MATFWGEDGRKKVPGFRIKIEKRNTRAVGS